MNSRYFISLTLALSAVWFLWSGHTEPFLLVLGAMSITLSMWMSWRMGVIDDEGAPAQLGIRPFTQFAPWLVWEIIKANFEVMKIVLSPRLKLRRNLIEVHAGQKSQIGRVILANSITLTPGTVSVNMEGDRILVHALSFEGGEEDLSGEMAHRICQLEKAST